MKSEFTNYLDYYKLTKFFQNALIDNNVSKETFGEHFLETISNVFGFDKSTFWLINPDNGTYVPISYRMESRLIEEYSNQYYKIDPFHPDNFLKRKIIKDVVSINDLMTFDEYETSPYYTKFLGKISSYYYQTVLYLHHKGTIIGGIALLRTKNERDLSKNDINLLKEVTLYISTITSNYLLNDKLKIKQNLYESVCNQSPVGLIIFQSYYPYKIQYFNSSASRYISDILNEKITNNLADQFIKQHILNSADFEQFGLSRTIISQSFKKYNLNVSPIQTTDENTLLVHAYIIPQLVPSEKQNFKSINNYNSLTIRQKEIIEFALHGFSNKEISEKLFISVSTVKTHLNNIYKEMKVSNRLGLYTKLMKENNLL